MRRRMLQIVVDFFPRPEGRKHYRGWGTGLAIDFPGRWQSRAFSAD